MAVEGNFIPYLRLLVVNPGVCHLGQHLTLEVFLDIFGQRHIFGVTQTAVWLRLALGPAPLTQNDLACFVAQWPFHRDGTIAECLIVKYTGDGSELHLPTLWCLGL